MLVQSFICDKCGEKIDVQTKCYFKLSISNNAKISYGFLVIERKAGESSQVEYNDLCKNCFHDINEKLGNIIK